MNGDVEPVKVVSILGNDYSIKAPAGEEQTLLEAARMLNRTLAETRQKYPALIGDKLLVLAALNLCSQQMTMQRAHDQTLNRYQEQVNATVEVISQAIGNR